MPPAMDALGVGTVSSLNQYAHTQHAPLYEKLSVEPLAVQEPVSAVT